MKRIVVFRERRSQNAGELSSFLGAGASSRGRAREGTVVLAFDVSNSMTATDVAPVQDLTSIEVRYHNNRPVALIWPDGAGPNMLLDDGGDATLLVHRGAEYEKAGKIPAFDPKSDPEEWGVILDLLNAEAKKNPGRWTGARFPSMTPPIAGKRWRIGSPRPRTRTSRAPS